MRSIELGKVGKKIRELRKERRMSLKDVAKKSGITAGLLSRIENFRTLPSLPVLHKISIALEVPLAELVETVSNPKLFSYILVKADEKEKEYRSDSESLAYQPLIDATFLNMSIMVNIVTVQPRSYRKPLSNDSMELVYVLKGRVRYGLKDTILPMRKGDTLYFDGRIPHSVENYTAYEAILFKVYLLRAY